MRIYITDLTLKKESDRLTKKSLKSYFQKLSKHILKGIDLEKYGLTPEQLELSLTLVDNAHMQDLNYTWRGKNKPTDVLSFTQLPPSKPVKQTKQSPIKQTTKNFSTSKNNPAPSYLEQQMLGDIVISVEKAREQATEFGHSLTKELERLLIHGILHLLGHEHVHGGQAARLMKRAEERLKAWCATLKK